MASRLVRVNPVTVNDVLDGHVSLDLECPDRLYLNGYLGQLQVGGQVVQFLRHRGFPVPSPACLQQIGDAFPPLGRLLRRRQPHPDGAVEVHRPQHRRDAPLPGFGCAPRPFTSAVPSRAGPAARSSPCAVALASSSF